ncbi:unnamed protein product [Cuscuta epithymum]|uniref:HMA domain-containing protein n=1 Tax=Cuscuta epithymum TaxID=186058 RepID=A0AAV0E163_9ASTE|nr:unnamed protein product [Cuscuta epithymum]
MEPKAEAGCVLKVDVQCRECKMKFMEVLASISGVYSVNIDAEQGLATVVGEVEPNALLRALSKSGEHAELVRVTLKDPRMNRYSNNEPSYAYSSPYNKSYDNGNYNNYGYTAIGDSNIRGMFTMLITYLGCFYLD